MDKTYIVSYSGKVSYTDTHRLLDAIIGPGLWTSGLKVGTVVTNESLDSIYRVTGFRSTLSVPLSVDVLVGFTRGI